MNIAIVCSCLEPGKDGVGDYTYLLASKLDNLGHIVYLISWNDRYVNVPQESSDSKVLQLPQSTSKIERYRTANQWIKYKKIDIFSIQIVSYGYHTKGLFMDHYYLKLLCHGYKTHLHFHELWVGMESHASFKNRCLGWVQRKCLVSFILYLQPDHITTSIELYQLLLLQQNIKATILPIFGNIQKAILSSLDIQSNDFPSIQILKSKVGDQQMLKVVFFGRIYPLVDLGIRIKEIKRQYTISPILCVQLGRTSPESIENLQKTCKEVGIDFVSLGGLEPNEVSAVLQFCDIGCSLMSGVFALKSGANHALFEHGKKVFYLDDFPLPSYLKPMDYINHNGLFCTFTAGMGFQLNSENESLGSESIAKKWLEICQ